MICSHGIQSFLNPGEAQKSLRSLDSKRNTSRPTSPPLSSPSPVAPPVPLIPKITFPKPDFQSTNYIEATRRVVARHPSPLGTRSAPLLPVRTGNHPSPFLSRLNSISPQQGFNTSHSSQQITKRRSKTEGRHGSPLAPRKIKVPLLQYVFLARLGWGRGVFM